MLQEIEGLEYMKTEKLEEMGMTFMDCQNLRTVKFNKTVYPKKKNSVQFTDTFRGCYNLQVVDLGGLVIESDREFFPNSSNLQQVGAYFTHNLMKKSLSLYLPSDLKYDQFN